MHKYSKAIRFLNDFIQENSNGKITSKNTNRVLRDTNADKTTVLFRHLRNNYILIVGYCC